VQLGVALLTEGRVCLEQLEALARREGLAP
jgi:hypothetical protein